MKNNTSNLAISINVQKTIFRLIVLYMFLRTIKSMCVIYNVYQFCKYNDHSNLSLQKNLKNRIIFLDLFV